MKNKKLFAILTLVCFMFTLMPVAAFAGETAVDPVAENSVATTLPAAENGVITLTQDVELASIVQISDEVTLDLNGKTISAGDGFSSNVLIYASAGGVLTVIDSGSTGTINASLANDSAIALWAYNGGQIIINAGTFKNADKEQGDTGAELIYASGEGSSVIINGGHFTGADSNAVLNKKDSDRKICTIKVKGGTFTGFNPADNKAEGEETDFVAPGYVAAGTNTWTVAISSSAVATNSEGAYETLAEAISKAAPNDTVTLLKSVDASEIITIDKAITLDGGKNTLTSTAGRAINVDTTGEVTIKDLTIVGGTGCERGINIINQAGTVNLTNVDVSGVSHYATHIATSAGAAKLNIDACDLTGYGAVTVYGAGSTVTVTDSALTGINSYADNGSNDFSTVAFGQGTTLTVNGGKIIAQKNEGCADQLIFGATKGSEKGAIITLDAELDYKNGTGIVGSEINDDITVYLRDDYADAVKAKGYATLTAGNGMVQVVLPVAATGVSLDKTSVSLYENGTTTLTATVTPENTLDTVTWTSSDETIATVDATGKVTAKKAGTATITATAGSFKAECAVTVSVYVPPYVPDYDYSDEVDNTPTVDEPVVENTTTADGTKVETTTTTDSNGTVTEVVETTTASGEKTTTTTVTLESGTSVTNSNTAVDVTVNEVESDVVTDAYKEIATDSNLNMVGGSDSAVNVSASSSYSGYDVESLGQPASVTVPVSDYAMSNVTNTGNLTLAKVVTNEDGTTSLEYVGGSYDEETGTFTAKVDEAGDYVLVEKDDLVNIELTINDTTVKENGAHQELDVAPEINAESRTMLPLRYIGEALGCDVDWNDATRTITITQDGNVFTMTIDQIIPGFGAAPTIKDGRTLVPVRYISEMLGANVIWDPVDQTVTIVK